jgi:hypothetical protein
LVDSTVRSDADVVLNGHVHNYQRYPPLDPEGFRDGVRHHAVHGRNRWRGSHRRPEALHPSASRLGEEFGYLRMTLQPTRWIAEFVSYEGKVLDKSSGTCHT